MAIRDKQTEFDLALHRVPGISASLNFELLRIFGDAERTLLASETELRRVPGITGKILNRIRNPDWHGVEQDMLWLDQDGHGLLSYRDNGYPALLKEIHDPPVLLFINGIPEVLNRPQVSMVGSRRPTAAGKQISRTLAGDLARKNLVITSGLATGIDSMCHTGALDAGGVTVAVLGNGLDQIYPSQNQQLAEAIIDNGVIISEYPVGTRPLKHHFPARNRIISGLSMGTVVIEAAKRSGSLITARFAAEQGREVFAVPGSILNPMSEGCHWLIRQGAKLTEAAKDVTEELTVYGVITGSEPEMPDDASFSP
ncbi:MAG: DNA-processing protein DprA, partial [Gammaproteobacteria bacterium]|nr:DNA-processing protein DprA [Gammaproteobacteria bacterium]